MVEEIDRGPGTDLPGRHDRRAHILTVPPRTPGEALFLDHPPDLGPVEVVRDPKQREWAILQLAHQLPLVREHRDAGKTPGTPEIQHDHLAHMLTQRHGSSIDIVSRDFR